MLSFRHFRERTPRFQPRTPAAAMRAVGAGFAEVEELVYQGTGVRPLIEEPYDLMELQRVLTRSGLDLEMCLVLAQIFGRMLHDPEPERERHHVREAEPAHVEPEQYRDQEPHSALTIPWGMGETFGRGREGREAGRQGGGNGHGAPRARHHVRFEV